MYLYSTIGHGMPNKTALKRITPLTISNLRPDIDWSKYSLQHTPQLNGSDENVRNIPNSVFHRNLRKDTGSHRSILLSFL